MFGPGLVVENDRSARGFSPVRKRTQNNLFEYYSLEFIVDGQRGSFPVQVEIRRRKREQVNDGHRYEYTINYMRIPVQNHSKHSDSNFVYLVDNREKLFNQEVNFIKNRQANG